MRFKAHFRAPRIDFGLFLAELSNELGNAIALGVFEWLSEAVDAVPVWSGASRATFLPLASQINFAVQIDRSDTARRGGFNLGLSNATGDLVSDAARGQFFFTYATSLEHLIYNEFNNGNIVRGPGQFTDLITPGPYGFTEKGKAAFLRVAATVRLPDVNVKATSIRVS